MKNLKIKAKLLISFLMETAALIEGSNQRVGEGNRYVARTNESLEAVVKSA